MLSQALGITVYQNTTMCVFGSPGAKAEELRGRRLSLEMPIASQYHAP